MVQVIASEDVEKDLVPRPRVTLSAGDAHRSDLVIGEHVLVIDEPEARGGTDQGPTPLQTFVGALCGCEATTFHKTARDRSFAYEGLDMKATHLTTLAAVGDAEATRIQTIRLQVTVRTDESHDRFRAVVEETEARCPVLAMLTQTDVNLEIVWVHGGL